MLSILKQLSDKIMDKDKSGAQGAFELVKREFRTWINAFQKQEGKK